MAKLRQTVRFVQKATGGGGGDPPRGEDHDTPGGEVKTLGGLTKSDERHLRRVTTGTSEQVESVIELHRKQRNIPYSATTFPVDPLGSMANGINRMVNSASTQYRMYRHDVGTSHKLGLEEGLGFSKEERDNVDPEAATWARKIDDGTLKRPTDEEIRRAEEHEKNPNMFEPPAGGDLPPQTEGDFQLTEEEEQEARGGGAGDPHNAA